MIQFVLRVLFFFFVFPQMVFAFPFTTIKRDSSDKGPVVLITAGIHGDEPAAFLAAGMLINNYAITSGRVWIVPNLNFQSILHTSRGIAGDMNRKFRGTTKNDPDYVNLEAIKKLILHPDVDFVYSMHDGSGFYREKHQSTLYSPYRWGQCVVIDQEMLDNSIPHYNLQELATKIVANTNTKLIAKNEAYRVRNTKTNEGNNPMEQSLTWFSVQNGKASLGVEASKNIPLSRGVYYHLLALETLLTERGVTFERNFELTPQGVHTALYDIELTLFDSYTLPIRNIRPSLRYMPFPSSEIKFHSSNPLLYIYKKKNAYVVQYGNTILTTIHPEFIQFDRVLSSLQVLVDGTPVDVPMGTVFDVQKNFSVPSLNGYRLNIIGYVNSKKKNEFDCLVTRKVLLSQYSIDTTKQLYRIELYKGDAFVGLIYARFPQQEATAIKKTKTATTI